MTAPFMTHRTAGILSVGDELTLGQTLDTNSRWLSSRLMNAGVVPVEHVTVPDDLDAQVDALRRLAGRVDLIVSSGGLGPTADDLTREALARASDDALVEDPMALAQIEAFYAARGRVMNPNNRVQALRPSRGSTLPNLHGTAPGLWTRLETTDAHGGRRSCDVFCLPGPPKEMFPMFEQHVLARVRLPEGRCVRTRVLHTVGLPESELAARLGPLMDRGAIAAAGPSGGVMVGTTASGGVVSIRMRYEGASVPIDAEAMLDATEAGARDAAGAYIFGREDETLASVVLGMLRSRGQVLGAVESCTGGLLGASLTAVPGSSAGFAGGLVTYSNALKTQFAFVDASLLAPGGPGAVSVEVAGAMAQGGLRALACDHCLAITGIAGPDGGSPAKPVGTVCIARASRGAPGEDALDVRTFRMVGDREAIRQWSVLSATAMLWQHLAGLPTMTLLREVVPGSRAVSR